MVKRVLFICLGNTCRSQTAHAVFENLVKEKGVQEEWEVDSAGIANWHVGKHTDPRAQKVLKEHGITFTKPVRQVRSEDFTHYDFIFGMDNYNIKSLKSIAPRESHHKIQLLGSYDPEKILIIEDPYCDRDGQEFRDCYVQCLRSCTAFLEQNS